MDYFLIGVHFLKKNCVKIHITLAECEMSQPGFSQESKLLPSFCRASGKIENLPRPSRWRRDREKPFKMALWTMPE